MKNTIKILVVAKWHTMFLKKQRLNTITIKFIELWKNLTPNHKLELENINLKKVKSFQYEYLINRNFKADQPFHKLFTDVTYILLNDYSKSYLSPILDSYNNQIIVFIYYRENDKNIIVKLLRRISLKIPKNTRVIINSDHGSIYFSKEYEELISKKFIGSMLRMGNCLDNRPIEYWFSIFRQEWLNKNPFKERVFEKVNYKITKFITYYNKYRIQACLKYMTPNNF